MAQPPDLQVFLTAVAQRVQLPLRTVLTEQEGRFHTAGLGPDTLILDLQEHRFCIWPDASPRAFEIQMVDGRRRIVLVVEGDDSRYHPYAPWTDLEWLLLEEWPPDHWTLLSTIGLT